MCAEYQINKTPREIREFLGRNAGVEDSSETRWPRVKLYGSAPVVVGEELAVRVMQFSLLPPGTKFSTFNARLYDYDPRREQKTTILEKRTWKKPFSETRCLLPMTSFYEPIYRGPYAGQVVEFRDETQPILFAAGFYQVSKDPKTNQPFSGFTIITDRPGTVVRATGHHRQPVFLKPGLARAWLSSDLDPVEALSLLEADRQDPDFKVSADRSMAKGWEKRIAINLEKAEREAHLEELTRQ